MPSAIISGGFNYVVKTSPANIDRIKILDDKPLMPDERLENILLSIDIKKLKKLSKTKATILKNTSNPSAKNEG